MFRVRFSEKDKQCIVKDVKKYWHLNEDIAIRMFLPINNTYVIVDESEPADICIVGIQHTNNDLLRKNEINIFLSVENTSVGRTHYQHWNKFGRNGNPMIKWYIYNDIPHPVDNIIPTVYGRIRYYHEIKKNYNFNIPFNEKKFCLFTSRNMLNSNKELILRELSKMGEIDTLEKYNISDKSCYHSPELLEIYANYKFIICFENSKTNGYVTEKIFNVFLSGSIPIYDGAPNIVYYIERGSCLLFDKDILRKVNLLNNKEIYEHIIKKEKVKIIEWTQTI